MAASAERLRLLAVTRVDGGRNRSPRCRLPCCPVARSWPLIHRRCCPGSVSPLRRRPLAWHLPALHGPALSCRTTTSPLDQLPVLLMGRTPSPPRARGRADGVCQGDRYHQSPTPTTPQPPDLVVLVAERTPPRGNITHQRLAMAIVSGTARSPTTQTGRQAAGTAPTHPCPVPRCRL